MIDPVDLLVFLYAIARWWYLMSTEPRGPTVHIERMELNPRKRGTRQL
ncbi:hypothetical protein [Lentzea albida]|uniref:Uncharacterized protein n=1 Tax=Lentzea albida TaxID=65499 RepID=A0A1H9X504_9PSEU|nr:hypothetical protein [Lentzea albida]SES41159.1 hypothetical protein SAMN04488000_12783 [Lentzea albida]